MPNMLKAGSIAKVEELSATKVRVTTTPCVVCNNTSEFTLDADKFWRWQNGEKIQNVFPDMSVGNREILISATHDPCFKKLFGGGDW